MSAAVESRALSSQPFTPEYLLNRGRVLAEGIYHSPEARELVKSFGAGLASSFAEKAAVQLLNLSLNRFGFSGPASQVLGRVLGSFVNAQAFNRLTGQGGGLRATAETMFDMGLNHLLTGRVMRRFEHASAPRRAIANLFLGSAILHSVSTLRVGLESVFGVARESLTEKLSLQAYAHSLGMHGANMMMGAVFQRAVSFVAPQVRQFFQRISATLRQPQTQFAAASALSLAVLLSPGSAHAATRNNSNSHIPEKITLTMGVLAAVLGTKSKNVPLKLMTFNRNLEGVFPTNKTSIMVRAGRIKAIFEISDRKITDQDISKYRSVMNKSPFAIVAKIDGRFWILGRFRNNQEAAEILQHIQSAERPAARRLRLNALLRSYGNDEACYAFWRKMNIRTDKIKVERVVDEPEANTAFPKKEELIGCADWLARRIRGLPGCCISFGVKEYNLFRTMNPEQSGVPDLSEWGGPLVAIQHPSLRSSL